MAGAEATVPGGIRVANHISLGVLTASVPLDVVSARAAPAGQTTAVAA